ncbi:MAG: DUF819 family protein [Proteobacteria bacterium]|nr:DUF819 family protein [Pseudomonadota bacterium]TDJ36764.1 MAG: DUF819 family protein [Gammaproteobacteria bacterium]
MSNVLISSPGGVLAVLCAVAAFWFYVEQVSNLKLFQYIPPLIFIYATPVFLNNLDVIPANSPVYSGLSSYALPAFIVLMLIKVNVPATVKIMGKGILVMLMGTAGVVAGCVISYLIVHRWLAPDAWTGFGALAGSWIGGTGNMAATSEMLNTPPEQFGLAVLADNVVYIVWLPILLASRNFADRFNAWAKVPEDRIRMMDSAAALVHEEEKAPQMRDYIYLVALAIGVTWIASALAPVLFDAMMGIAPDMQVVLSESTWRILLITTIALSLSTTPVSRLPNATAMGTALIYIFVAGMGARATIEGFGQAPAFLLGAFIWIFIHGAFCLAGAKLFRVDVHSVAIASAANIGAAASAPIVAAFHRPSLVPVSILMALIGYALGNYLAPLAGHLARLAAGQ